jgi:HlyD family secretion protein
MARTNQATAAQSTVASTRAQVENAVAQLKEAEVRLGYTKIYSPVTGTVLVRAAREGEVVNAGQAIVTVVDFSDTWVFAAIPETDADHIGLGDTLRVRLPGGTVVPGKVFYKAAEADFATQRDVGRRKRDIRTIALKVRLDNPKGAYVPGMTAEVLVSPQQLKGRAGFKVSEVSKRQRQIYGGQTSDSHGGDGGSHTMSEDKQQRTEHRERHECCGVGTEPARRRCGGRSECD